MKLWIFIHNFNTTLYREPAVLALPALILFLSQDIVALQVRGLYAFLDLFPLLSLHMLFFILCMIWHLAAYPHISFDVFYSVYIHVNDK